MKKRLWAALLISIVFVLASPFASADSPNVDLTASAWAEITGNGVLVPLNNDASGNLYLDFPSLPNTQCHSHCDNMGYLYTTGGPNNITGGTLVLTLRVDTLSGSPVFQDDDWPKKCPNNPPTVRPFFWSHNGSYADGDRWWARYAYGLMNDLASGATEADRTITLTVPLDPANFGGVYGELANQDSTTLGWWSSALADVTYVGVTFGGGCNAGHGLYTTGGSARFTLLNYDTQPPCPTVQSCGEPSYIGTAEISASSTGIQQCLKEDGTSLVCTGSQTINTVTKQCRRSECCNATPVGCYCVPPPPPSGDYLECR